VPATLIDAHQWSPWPLPHDGDRAYRQLQQKLMLTISLEKSAFIIAKT
jgi:hypothetical protein